MKREVENGLLSYLRNAQAQRRRNVVLNWKRAPPRPGDWVASHGRQSLWIVPQDNLGDSEAAHELRYCWEGGGDRRLATGEVPDLKVHASELLSRGGPYGGPSFSSPLSCRWPAFRFETVHSWSGAEVACYGAGWQMWARPLSKTHCCLVQVSPTGSFRVIGCGSFPNMALIAQREACALGAIEDDVPIAHEPFQVRVSGKPTRLLHSTGGPVVGWATTALGDVFLVLLGEDDAALVLLTESDEGMEGGDLRVLRRGPPFGINDLEISPGFVTQAHPYGPIHPTPELCARSIEGMASASDIVRQEGVRLVRAAVDAPGMRFARLVLRSIFALHEAGRRSCSAGRLVELLGDFVAAGLIDKLPCDRTYRSAMQWLADEIGIVERLDTTRWAIHYEEIATPSDRLCAEIKDAQRRASTGAE